MPLLSIKLMKEITTQAKQNSQRAFTITAIAEKTGWQQEMIVSFFARIGMTPHELIACPNEIFAEDYEENLNPNGSYYRLLKKEDMAEFIQLCRRYGATQVCSALHNRNAETIFDFYQKHYGFHEYYKNYLSSRPIKYESNIKFFEDINALLRKADPKIPNYKERWRAQQAYSTITNPMLTTPSSPLASHTVFHQPSPIESLKRKIDLLAQAQENELPMLPDDPLVFSPEEKDAYQFSLRILFDNLAYLDTSNNEAVKEWLKRLDNVIGSKLRYMDSENVDKLMQELQQHLPIPDERAMKKLKVLTFTHPNLLVLSVAKLCNLNISENVAPSYQTSFKY